jgi:DNA helicase-2/ATP-dependent DNA helicase PcrA
VDLNLHSSTAGVLPVDLLISLGSEGRKSPYWELFTARGAAVLSNFGALLVAWQEFSKDHSLPDLFSRIVKDTGFKEYINDGTDIGEGRWDNVLELRRLAYEYEQRDLTEFLENIALVSDQDTVPDAPQAPTLLTLHAAKGLEYDLVYIVGLDEGLLPHSRSFEEPEEMAEERRLFYVGITRAKNHLVLVRASRRNNYGRFEYTVQSRFLDDIPEDLIKREGIRLGIRSINPLSQPRWMPTVESRAEKAEPSYKAGMRVIHPTWGDGMVVETRVMGTDETVTVMFETVGLKRLAASIAKLEIVS